MCDLFGKITKNQILYNRKKDNHSFLSNGIDYFVNGNHWGEISHLLDIDKVLRLENEVVITNKVEGKPQ